MRMFVTISRAVIVACLIVIVAESGSRAGDRELKVLLVDMTPNALSTEASNACVHTIRKKLLEDYVRISRMGESRVRSLVGEAVNKKPFLSWTGMDTKTARGERAKWPDTLLLIDCRPEAQTLDVLVSTRPPRKPYRLM